MLGQRQESPAIEGPRDKPHEDVPWESIRDKPGVSGTLQAWQPDPGCSGAACALLFPLKDRVSETNNLPLRPCRFHSVPMSSTQNKHGRGVWSSGG